MNEKTLSWSAPRRQTSLARSLVIQARVIYALMMREVITRYGRDNIGFMWVFVEPMIFTLGVTALWNVYEISKGESGMSVTALAWTGYSTVMLWRNATSRCAKAVEPNLGLLYHKNVRVLDLFFSRVILEILGGTLSTLFVGLILMGAGLIVPPKEPVIMIGGWFLLIWYTFGVGMIVGALSERWEAFERLYHPVMYFYLGISGCFFMVDWLPSSLQRLAELVPTVTVTEMMRHGYAGDAVHTYEQPGYLCVFCLLLTISGLLLARQTQERIGRH
ncbi:MAG: ABC transporter permease [Syntrophobacteraceae bacterium]|nr:ABC transporter permease [Syntrophobacteraceae bacterium]